MKALIKKTAVLTAVFLVITSSAAGASDFQKVASGSEHAAIKTVTKYGMTPIYPKDIKDGTYEVEVESSSSFFRIKDAVLTVDGEEMTLKCGLNSTSYSHVYPGTGLEAAAAEEKDYIPLVDEEMLSTFSLPVKALNQEFDCCAFSIRKKKWYDRKLLIDASSLPEEAVAFPVPDYDRIQKAMKLYDKTYPSKEDEEKAALSVKAVPVSLSMPDGEYSIEVSMTGGSGRASVSSPTLLIVRDGKAYAKLLWSSAYYDYMYVEGEKFLNETTDGGNSTFTIPITAMDAAMPVIADTTAMGDPVEIEYSLTFYADSIGDKGLIPQEAAKKVLVIAIIIMIVGGILNYFWNKKKKH